MLEGCSECFTELFKRSVKHLPNFYYVGHGVVTCCRLDINEGKREQIKKSCSKKVLNKPTDTKKTGKQGGNVNKGMEKTELNQ